MSARILNAQGILSSDVPTGNLVWVDHINGVDALAARGGLTIPFKTLTAAKNVAKPATFDGNGNVTEAGDTVVVLPGLYLDEKNLLKHGVNWHFLPGAVVKYTATGGGGIFDTSSDGTNGAVTSLISGHGEFVVTATGGTNHVVHASAANSKLVIQARSLYSATAPTVKLTQANSGYCHIDVLEDIICTGGDVVVFNASVAGNSLRARDLITSGGRCIYVSTGSGSLDVTVRKMTASAGSTVEVQGGSGSLVVRAYEVYSQSKPADFYNTTNGMVLTVLGARVVSQGPVAADGRSIHIGSNSPDKVRLASCVLIASSYASESIYAATNPTRVHILNGAAINKAAANVTPVGGSFSTPDNSIN